MAEAVQELVLCSTASANSASSAGAGAGAASEAPGKPAPASAKAEAESAPPLPTADLPLAPALAAAGGGRAGASQPAAAAGGAATLGLLRSEDQADIQAAAQLVLAMCGSMQVDPSELSRGERLQLIYTMLAAWQAQQGRRHADDMSRRARGGCAAACGGVAAGRGGRGRLAGAGCLGLALALRLSDCGRRLAACTQAP